MLQKVLYVKTNSSYIQLFRYFVTGGIAFIVDLLVLYLFTEFFLIHYLLSAAIAFMISLIVNYTLSIKWVFNKRNLRNKFSEFSIFSLIGIIGLGLNEIVMWIFTEYLLFFYLVSKLFSAFVVFIWNFSIRKILLFK